MDNKLLVNELLERIRHYKIVIEELEGEVEVWHDAFYKYKAQFPRENIISEPPYYDTMKTTGVGEQKHRFDASPTLDNLVDLERKLKQADTIGC